MSTIGHIALFFSISLGFGLYTYSFLADPKNIGSGFFKLIYVVSGISFLISEIILLSGQGNFVTSPVHIIFLFISFIICCFQYYFQKERRDLIQIICFILMLALQLSSIYYFCLIWFQPEFLLESLIAFFLSLHFFGIITYSMLMGHWYLVVPKLSEKPLLKATYITWFILILKAIISLKFFISQNSFFDRGTTVGMGYIFNWVIFSMRISFGYFLIGILSFFSWRLIKMRSIQSATGVLYVMTIFVFMSELLATYFALKMQMYF